MDTLVYGYSFIGIPLYRNVPIQGYRSKLKNESKVEKNNKGDLTTIAAALVVFRTTFLFAFHDPLILFETSSFLRPPFLRPPCQPGPA